MTRLLATDHEAVAAAAAALEHADAADVIAWAVDAVPRLAVTSSFGADSAVLLHLLAGVTRDVPVLFLDTGLHFDQTHHFRRTLADDLGLHVVDVRPTLSLDQQADRYGDRLWERDPDACCGLRKTTPIRAALRDYDGWASGVRRSQTPERAGTPVVEARHHDDRWLVKIAPLATWSDADVDGYLRAHDLPRHPLWDAGYPSIGCRPCTARVAPGDDPRAGRWAAFGGKTECGIHLDGPADVARGSG